MKKVLFMCNAGMSTSLLAERVKKESIAQGDEMEIKALNEQAGKEVLNQYDAVLLGPQIGYLEDSLKKMMIQMGGSGKLAKIDMKDYGRMDAKAIYNQIKSML
ncbi:MAG: PTS sugar transporter subunit IIB [Alphaproteobacteria bacterium]|nr:PTS sugar transporter subunit IIB [Alphaproteobacteria bacterium]